MTAFGQKQPLVRSTFTLGILADTERQLLYQRYYFFYSLLLDHQSLSGFISRVTGFPNVIIIDDTQCVGEQVVLLKDCRQLFQFGGYKMLIITMSYSRNPKG